MININKNLFLNRADNISVVVSEGRGSGKTWLSFTLAHALYLCGKRVLFVDSDNSLTEYNGYNDNNQTFYLNDVISDRCTLNQAIRPLKKKFDVISAASGSNLLENLPIGRLQLLGDDLLCLAKNYDQIILGVTTSASILHNFVPNGCNALLLCNNNPSSLVMAYKFLQNESTVFAPHKLKVIVNYANAYEEGMQTYKTLKKACEQYIGYAPELLGIIRNDANVREAIAKHSLFLTDYASSPAAVDVMNIARSLLRKGEENATRI